MADIPRLRGVDVCACRSPSPVNPPPPYPKSELEAWNYFAPTCSDESSAAALPFASVLKKVNTPQETFWRYLSGRLAAELTRCIYEHKITCCKF